ncbi:MAG: hypothetical protein JWR07_1583 [Nevskia sp.]|nr:hypothetical protein [Nevskia sp.]
MAQHWLNRERLRLYSLGCLIVYLGWVCILVGRSHGGIDPSGKPLGFDFIAFWGASRLALAGHAVGAYDLHTLLLAQRAALPGLGEGLLGPWQYPPTFFLLVLPLGLMPYFVAYFCFVGATFIAFALVMRRILAVEGLAARTMWLPLLGFPAVMINAFEGQNGFLTASLMGLALLLLPTRPACGGMMMGLLAVKPHLGLLLPLALLCGGQWRALLYAAFSASGFLALSVAVLGGDTLLAFFDRLPQVADWVARGEMPLVKMPTFFAFARLLGLPVQGAYLVHALGALLAALGVGWVWRNCVDWALRSAALLVATLLISPYLFDYDLVWLAPALAWFTGYAMRRGWLSWEREFLVLVWVLPLISMLSGQFLHLQPAAPVLSGFLLLILRRVKNEMADGVVNLASQGN